MDGEVLEDIGKVVVVLQLPFVDPHPQARILLQGILSAREVVLEVLAVADALVQAPQQHVVLVPGELLLGDELGEVGIFAQDRRDAVADELEVGVALLLGGVELGPGRFDTRPGFVGQRTGEGEQEQVQVPGGLT